MTDPTEPTDETINRLLNEKESVERDTLEAEQRLETPQANRPAFKINPADTLNLKLECFIDFLMPMEGPGATNTSRRQRILFDCYFLARYKQMIESIETEANRQWAEAVAEARKKQLQASPADMAAISKMLQKP